MNIELQAFGQARELFEQSRMTLVIDKALTVEEFRQTLFMRVKPRLSIEKAQAIINVCAVATESEILQGDAVLNQDMSLALLPPVCGG